MSYNVVRGDSLWGIYKRNKAKGNTSSWDDYKKANPKFADGQMMHEGDSVTIPNETIPENAFDEPNEKVEVKEKTKKEPVEQNKTSEEKAEEAVEETKNESSKNSEAADCCCMVAPWTIQQEKRSYVLDMTELYINPDGSKTARELVSKDQEKKEHKLYVIAPPKKDDAMQFKKINVTYEFMRKKQKCELMMLAKSERYRESMSIENFFEINSLGRIKNAQHNKSDKIEEPNFPHKSIDGIGSKSHQYRVKKEELNRLYKEYEKETKPYWKNYLLSRIRNKEIELERFLGAYNENSIKEGSLKHLVYNILGLNGVSNVIQIYPSGSNKCKTQPIAEIHVQQKSVYKGELTASFSSQYTTAKVAKRENKQRNERIDVVRKGFRVAGKIDYEYGDTHYILEGGIGKNLDAEGNKTTDNVKRKYLKRVNAEDIFKKQRKNVAGVIRFLEEVGGGKVNVNTGVTKFTLKVEGSHDEDLEGYELQRVVDKFEVEVALFDNSSISVDILGWALTKGGPIGNVIALAKEYAEEKGQELKIEFSMGGKLAGFLKYARPDPKKSWIVGGEAGISGSINMEVVASVKIDGSILWVKVSAGAYIKSASKETEDNKTEISANIKALVNDKDELMVNGSFEFNGLTIYAAAFIEVGMKLDNTHKNGKNDGRNKDMDKEIDFKREHKAKGKLPLVDEWKPEPTKLFSIEKFLK